jgi:glucokinase
MEYAISIDLGGTKIATCLVNETGKIVYGTRVLTCSKLGRKKVLENLTGSIRKVMDKYKDYNIKGIGIGIPGFVDNKGNIVFMPNVPLVGVNIADYLKKMFSCPVYVENDANCFAFGEYHFGKHKANLLLGIIVGTGIGCGIVYNGRVISGARGGAGEIGHIMLDNTAKKLLVSRNDFESYCSGPNIERRYVESGGKQKICKKIFMSNSPLAKKTVNDEYEYLGKLLGNVVNTLNPDTVIFGGGVSHALDTKRMENEIKKYCIPFTASTMKVKDSRLDDLASVLGAAALVFKH